MARFGPAAERCERWRRMIPGQADFLAARLPLEAGASA